MSRIKAPSLTQLGLALLALFLLLMGGAWLHLRHEVGELRRLVDRQQHENARRELAHNVDALVQRVGQRLRELAALDETRQFLLDREYYVLWRDERLPASGLLPVGTRGLALYDARGGILAPGRDMPARIAPVADLSARALVVDDQPGLLLLAPVLVHPDRADIHMGYLGLMFEPLQALRELGSWHYGDPATLTVALKPGEVLEPAALSRHVRITARGNREYHTPLDRLEETHDRLSLYLLVMLALLLVLLRRLLITPIRRLSQEIMALRQDPLAKVREDATGLQVREITTLRQVFHEYHARLQALHGKIEEASRSFYHQARHDALSGCHNRRAFEEDWQGIEQDKRVSQCTLLLFDCDHFKAINDTYGHPTGDRVIRALAVCLTHALRAGDRLYRLGGDEFATLLPGTNLDTALTVAQRCLERIQAYDFRQYGITEPVNLSIGLAHGSAPLDLATLHKQADLAMYHAKRPGHPKIVVYEAALGELASLVDNRDVSAVYEAIRQGNGIEFRYQPIVRLHTLKVQHVEALCRIRCDARLIGPGAILAIVHNRRLDVEFDLAVLRAIRRDLEADLPELRQGLAINLSALGIVSDAVIDALLALKHAYPERKIVVEITETALITQMDTATAHIQRLRAAGCLVALDDFGSGYSSLRYLASMPVDMVKFDMSLVRLLEQPDQRQRLVVEDIAEIVATAGYELVAEGIESEGLMEKARAVGFTHGQGFYFDGLSSNPLTTREGNAVLAGGG